MSSSEIDGLSNLSFSLTLFTFLYFLRKCFRWKWPRSHPCAKYFLGANILLSATKSSSITCSLNILIQTSILLLWLNCKNHLKKQGCQSPATLYTVTNSRPFFSAHHAMKQRVRSTEIIQLILRRTLFFVKKCCLCWDDEHDFHVLRVSSADALFESNYMLRFITR